MKVYAKVDRVYKDFKNINIATAVQGFRDFGIEVVKYQNTEDILSEHDYGDIVLDGVNQVRYVYEHYGIETPDFDYPEELANYYGRTFWQSTLNTVYNDESKWGIFIKSVEDKKFTGKVVRTLKDFVGLGSAYEDIDVLCCEALDIKAEWRAFVRYDRVLDIRPYNGDWHYHFDPKVVDDTLVAFQKWSARPNGCSIDFGVTSDGRTVIIEVNDGYSLGCYGLQAYNYAKLISARSSQLFGIKDDLITAQDIAEGIINKEGFIR